MIEQESISRRLENLYDMKKNLIKNALFKCPDCHSIAEVDNYTSENYYLCRCLKCGKSWKVSKRQLVKEEQQLDRAIAELEGEKIEDEKNVGLKDKYSKIFGAMSFLISIAALVFACISYFG